jgi:hypothetical protein
LHFGLGNFDKQLLKARKMEKRMNIDEKETANRAYALWEARGRPIGSPDTDWFEAEFQLRTALDIPRPVRPEPRDQKGNDGHLPIEGSAPSSRHVLVDADRQRKPSRREIGTPAARQGTKKGKGSRAERVSLRSDGDGASGAQKVPEHSNS